MHFATRLGLDHSSVRGIPSSSSTDAAALVRENQRLRARVAELELALKASASVSATVPSSATPAAENKNSAPTITSAKLKEEPSGAKHGPWTELGISRRTYYRRKAAGAL